jgi:hypothetical protein
METPILSAISEFFDAVAKLRKLGVIRSDKYLGDLAEYIGQHFYEIELAVSGRQVGYDGVDKEGKVQVKYHGSPTRTNIDLGDPNQYDNLLVVLGPGSLLRSTSHAEEFLVYRMSSATARRHLNQKKGTYSCGKLPFARQPDKVLSFQAAEIKLEEPAPSDG